MAGHVMTSHSVYVTFENDMFVVWCITCRAYVGDGHLSKERAQHEADRHKATS
jgi:hypothetical protein